MVHTTKGRSEPLYDLKAKPVCCPLCLQPLTSGDFLHTEDFGILVRNAHIAQLSLHESMALKLLMRRKETTHEMLAADLYGNSSNGGPDNARTSIYGTLNNLRRKLHPLGIMVCLENRRWWIRFQ